MKVKTYCINKGSSSQYFGLITEEGQVLQYAPNNWKTEAGALRWARNHGYEIATKQTGKKKSAPVRAAASGSGGAKSKATAKQQPKKNASAQISGGKQKTQKKDMPVKSRREREYEIFDRNQSAVIPRGRTFQTRDEFIQGGAPKKKYEDKPKVFYRTVIVVDTNDLDELAVVKKTTSPKAIPVKDKKRKISVRPILHTLDDEGNPIKKGKKFVENSAARDISPEATERIKRKAIRYPEDYKKLHDMKKRRKKKQEPGGLL